MLNKKFDKMVIVYSITIFLIIGLLCISDSLANQPCFKCCGSRTWHVDNKIPCSGKNCKYCVKCNGCTGTGQIPDSARRCEKCGGLGQIHKNSKKICTNAGCKFCTPCKECKTKGWVKG